MATKMKAERRHTKKNLRYFQKNFNWNSLKQTAMN